MTLYLICTSLHILAVSLWIGHMFFWTLIIGPATKRLEPPENKEKLRSVSIRKGGLGWPALVILILTGTYILNYKGVTFSSLGSGDFFQTPYGQVLSVKLLLVLGMMAYQAFVGHRPAPKLIYVNMLAAFCIIALSILLVRGVQAGKPDWDFHYPSPFLKNTETVVSSRIMDLGPVEFSEKSPEFTKLLSREGRLERLATGFQFLEGPVCNGKDGALLFSDIPADTIYQWAPGEGISTFRSPSGKSNGLALDDRGRLIAAEHVNRRITRTEEDGSIVTLASHYNGKRLNSPNDLALHQDGTFYFTDPDYGLKSEHGMTGLQELSFAGVYRLSSDGRSLTLMTNDLSGPNGITLSADGKKLYISDQERSLIMVYEIRTDGTLDQGSVFAKFQGRNGTFDGLKVDVEDHLYAAGSGGIWIWDKTGKELGRIMLPEFASNLNWCDADRKGLYITASSSLYRIRMNIPGRTANSVV